jgi:transposase
VVVVRTVRPKFVPKGQARGDETTVLQGEPLELPIPRGLAGPGLLADTIVKRLADHTPLHRMERIYARDGLFLSRQTICGWHLTLSELVRVLLDAMWADALDSPYLCVDATGVLVQHAEKCKRGHFFVVIAPEKHVLFRFSEKHNNAAVDAMLAEYVGILVADAHVVFDHLFLGGQVREAGCWAHARRYFFKALSTEPQRARRALEFFEQLFTAERHAKGLSPEQRKERRALVHEPIVAAFERWCDDESLKVVDESPLAKAIAYARNQRAALRTFLDDGRVPIDNNWSERELRRIAWGRDNWLFVGSEDGGEATANFVSLIASCQLHGLEPLAYLRDLFCLLPWWPKSQVLDLAPARWKATVAQPDVEATLAKNVFRRVALGEIEPPTKK